jgi:hypothetical protein
VLLVKKVKKVILVNKEIQEFKGLQEFKVILVIQVL